MPLKAEIPMGNILGRKKQYSRQAFFVGQNYFANDKNGFLMSY
jgi:hypothetical protein